MTIGGSTMLKCVGIEIYCLTCSASFQICNSCYRGQKYCSDSCRKTGYVKKHRKIQRNYESSKKGKESRLRYQISEIGRENHSKRQYDYRIRKNRSLSSLTPNRDLSPNHSPQNIRDAEDSQLRSILITSTTKINKGPRGTCCCMICNQIIERLYRDEIKFRKLRRHYRQ